MDLFFLVKCYSEWIIQIYKIIHNKMITMRKALKQPKKKFNACKKCLKNKKIVLQSKFIFITEKMLQITKK